MSHADLIPVDDLPLNDLVAELTVTGLFGNGVWRDRPWVWVPHRAWVYREPVTYERFGNGLWEPTQQIGVEACFPFTVQQDGRSDLEVVGSALAAAMELAIFRHPDRGIEGADTMMLASNWHELPQKSRDGQMLGRVVMLIEVSGYARTAGNPYTREARVGG